MVHMSCQVITCSLPFLLHDEDFKEPWTTSDCGAVIGFASLAAALGYAVHGPCIDRWGVVYGWSVALGGCAVGLFLLATAETQVQFGLGAGALRFAYAAGWPAEMKALKLLVPEEHQGMAVSSLGFASRGGAILGRCLFAALSAWVSWRDIAKQASWILCLGGGGIILGITGHIAKAKPPSKALQKKPQLSLVLQEPAVWLLTAAFCCLCHVQHGDDFMPLLFKGLTRSSQSVTWSAVYPGGGIAAMLLNAWKGHLLSRWQRERLYVAACVASSACFFLLVLLGSNEDSESSTTSVAILLFIAAFCCAIPYYLVPNFFAFDLMGTNCATLVSFFELSSFCSKTPAHMLLLRLAETSWSLALLQMAVTMLCAGILIQLLLPRWRSLVKQPRPGGISPLTDSPPMDPGSPPSGVSDFDLDVAEYAALRK
eukprot:CAMPEP_0181456344 /NCGR_PEP_ID=MMETSP1110-20121109/31224_1 /TAXON_ID=174948 /ORGANISM="Symbiodinium sp., Strain CCMP421" /LENGTH=426 /DNA_ID=CAMNT_0023580755 /DNA_START=34 /DNA_END=1314 /DNA_ORIENTATION=-